VAAGDTTAKALLHFSDAIEEAEDHDADDKTNVGDIIKTLCKRLGYYKFVIERQKNKKKADDGSAASLIDTFANSCKRFNHIKELFDYIQRARDQQNSKDQNKVQMMTLHRSKGLEFKMVFVVGLCEGILPHKNSIKYDNNDRIIPESIEEERRLCYVGITRAKELLFLTAHSDQNLSPFFLELEPYTENIDEYYHALKEEWRS
jgi:DNA helicase-2/ATP-dependent DNA helicase PcrA